MRVTLLISEPRSGRGGGGSTNCLLRNHLTYTYGVTSQPWCRAWQALLPTSDWISSDVWLDQWLVVAALDKHGHRVAPSWVAIWHAVLLCSVPLSSMSQPCTPDFCHRAGRRKQNSRISESRILRISSTSSSRVSIFPLPSCKTPGSSGLILSHPYTP